MTASPRIGQRVRIKPTASGEGLKNPARNFKPLRTDGEFVDWSFFWIRREREGAIVRLSDAPASPAPATPKPEPAKPTTPTKTDGGKPASKKD